MNDANQVPGVAPSPGGKSTSYAADDLRSALGLVPGRPFNLGALLSDRLCQQGHGLRLALIWENHASRIISLTLSRYAS